MPHSHAADRPPPTRRHFLQILATAIGGAATAPTFAAVLDGPSDLHQRPVGRLKLGVVLPGFGPSGCYTASWLNGLQLAFDDWANIELSIEQGGGRISQVLAGVLRLGKQEPDIIVGATTPHNIPQVAQALERRSTIFFNVEPGGHIAHAAASHANVFHHSLHLWQANYAAGAQAACRFGTRGWMISSFREAGYDTASAFALGFASAGGQVLQQAVSHVPGRTHNPRSLIAKALSARTDFIYINASGAEAQELLALTPQAVLASPMARFAGAGNSTFAAAYQKFNGRKPDAYALLGFEAGNLIRVATQATDRSGESLSKTLQTAAFEGPRGLVQMDIGTRSTRARAFVDHSAAVIPDLEPTEEDIMLAHPDWQNAVSGWSVPYAG
ncbi:MAG: hypothetical protein JWR16_2346 [Nevskia sp.]|nr:hypothetical protein [Nevskia sp.]